MLDVLNNIINHCSASKSVINKAFNYCFYDCIPTTTQACLSCLRCFC